MLGELLHARLIAENASLCSLRTWVDSEHGQFSSLFSQHVHPKLVDARTLSGSRHTADAYTDRVPAIGKTFIDDFLSFGLMVWIDAFDECHGLRKDGNVALDNTFHHIGRGQFAPAETPAVEVWVDD